MAKTKQQNPLLDHTENDDGVCSKCGLEMIHVGKSQCVIETELEEEAEDGA